MGQDRPWAASGQLEGEKADLLRGKRQQEQQSQAQVDWLRKQVPAYAGPSPWPVSCSPVPSPWPRSPRGGPQAEELQSKLDETREQAQVTRQECDAIQASKAELGVFPVRR